MLSRDPIARTGAAQCSSNGCCTVHTSATHTPFIGTTHYIRSNKTYIFLLWNTNYAVQRRRYFLFGTEDSMVLLIQAPHLLIDGTFTTSPKQLVIFHGLFDDGWRIPLAYDLLPGKTTAHNETLLLRITNFGVEPQSVMF